MPRALRLGLCLCYDCVHQPIELSLNKNLFTGFFPIVDTFLNCEDIARQSCVMLRKWRFLRAVFQVSCVAYISDPHSKFALKPHHVWKYGGHPICDRWD